MRRDVFQAIADPTRRAILLLLASQAMTPNALADHFAVSRQAVSKHLKILNECDLIRPDPLGREIHYQLDPAGLEDVEHWIHRFRQALEGRFDQLDTLLHQLKKSDT